MNTSWKEALQSRRFVFILALSGVFLLILAFFMPYFFREVIAGKKGVQLHDVILERLPPADWSWTIFTLIYSTIVMTMATNYNNPDVILRGLAAYTAITWLRMGSIYLFTLEAPEGIIVLSDPFLSHVVYRQEYFVKDLFFSGHISSMVVFVLIEPNTLLRWIKIIATLLVSLLILIQHVHYTLDVVAAPVFTYGVYRAVKALTSP